MRVLSWIPALVAAVVLVLPACGRRDAAGEWAQWRGPGGQGLSSASDVPVEWSPGSPNIAWRVKIPGSGHSSPVVAGGRVFLATAIKVPPERPSTKRRALLALALDTGEQLWQKDIFTGLLGPRHWMNLGTSPTPVTDGRRVYAAFGSVVVALDWEGNIVWQLETEPEHLRYAKYGSSSSLLLADGAVIVMQDREDVEEPTGWIAAFDANSGQQLWREEWSDTCCSYSTPMLMGRPGGAQLIRYLSGQVVASDPRSGEELWTLEHPAIQTVPSPVWEDDLLILPGSMHSRFVTALRLTGSGKETRAEVAWWSRKSVPELASPVLVDGLLFTVNRGGILVCYDAATGELIYRQRLSPGEYVSSLVAAEGRVYATSDQGVTSVFAADRAFRLLAENRVGGKVFSSPAIAGGCFLVRTTEELVCIQKEQSEAAV